MPKKLKLTALAMCALIVCAAWYLLTTDRTDNPQQASPSTQVLRTENNSPQTTNSNINTLAPGKYEEYSEERIAAEENIKILFFHAPWCPQCRALEESIKNGTIPASVTIYKVDFDSSMKLRQKYGVTLQTTLVRIDDNGNELKKIVAYSDPTLDAINRELL